MLDDNRLSDVAVFAALAGLKRYETLKIFNWWKLEGFIKFSIYMYNNMFKSNFKSNFCTKYTSALLNYYSNCCNQL